MWKKLLGIACVSALVAGCSSPSVAVRDTDKANQTVSGPAEGMAGIYVYRNDLARTIDNNIFINGQCLGQSQKDSYFYIEVPGGTKQKLETIAILKNSVVDLDVKSGQTYFVRHYLQMHLVAPYANLEVISPAKGQAAIAKLSKLENGRCK